jgi:hypothetical protein
VSWVDTVSGQRMTPERLDAIRYNVMASHAYRVPNDVVRELLAELDAVTRERDEAQSERDSILEAVGRAVLPDLQGDGRKVYPWVKTAIREIERLAADRDAARRERDEVRSVLTQPLTPRSDNA